MFKTFTKIISCLLFSLNGFATANSVYHEFTMNTVGGGCGIFVSNLSPTNTDAVTIEFTIDYQLFTNQARIYYTTDGSTPSGSFGVSSGTTQVVSAAYFCSYNNGSGIVDIAQGSIPALPTGTIVKYIVSAWHSSGGLEIFASGGTNTSSATATNFSYTVSSALPISLLNFSAKKENTSVKLVWSTSQEINTNRYEVYASQNGRNFKNIGIKKAAVNSNTLTEYFFTDPNPVNGKSFYKLKIVDKDEHFTYSNVVTLLYDNNTSPITLTANILHVRLSSSQTENYIVAIINNSGQRLKTWTLTGNNRVTDYTFELPQNLSEGIYHIMVIGNASVNSKSLILQ
ncbi:MAG TPA: hypothetical protein VIL78_03260 [Hanamia sp.]